MSELPRPDRYDWAALAGALATLGFAYLIYPNQIIQYSAWLVVFTIWMVWFVYYGTKWFYGVET